ncbi:5-formyltetrahydrofolate cyclo-ligase [Radicibacter daui]|uniref:5-formyltetrahydrofolate cyclo-ligase n=1 Tax=Radicibacter daui TaxID=3064829 RepID=UPI004046FEA4
MNKTTLVRQRIWSRLKDVALPDSRFHLNFAEVIPDFQNSGAAIAHILALPQMQQANYVFVTPDNCLAELRHRLLEAGKTLVVSTYGIYRGFFLLDPKAIPPEQTRFAGWLDGLEYFGSPISLAEIGERGAFDLMITGASAVSTDGVRFGKGHGFFDLEWGMFTDIGVATDTTPVIAVVHDVQVVEDKLTPSPTDIIVDMIATPTRLIEVQRGYRRPHGIRWELLTPEAIEATPPLQELQRARGLLPA